ncbi:MAG: alpha/beta hydrolase, partial [Ilumatobacter sp.]|nr:alpha/beta hydrolase [Ilumatobacter sp.]
GGLIARHAVVGDDRLRAMGLVNTEQPQGLGFRFKLFLAPRRLPGFRAAFAWAVAQPRLRCHPLLLGDCFVDRSLIDGEFDEFFLRPIYTEPARLDAAMKLLLSFDERHVLELGAIHRRLRAPVQLVWGARDPFFPLDWAQAMVETFPDARLHVVPDAKLFVHEERPDAVAEALLGVLAG